MFELFNKKSKVITDDALVQEILTKGVEEIVEKKKLEEMLKSGKELRVKFGVDPTSPNIHIGRAVVLWKLRALQDLGHKIVLIVGDFTGVIGDTSDKDSERPMLSKETVEQNLKTYFDQMGKIIDLSKAERHYNSSWLSKLTYKDIGEQADQFSVSDFISRELIKKRLDAGTRISLREVLYPLMQGYDSVEVKADLELGGTDQRFNILAGRPMQIHYKQKPQQMLLTALLPGTDGRKMSSSWGNTINITENSADMYGKVMSITDEIIATYFGLATRMKDKEVFELKEKLKNGELHPKEVKMRLARDIVTLYHGEGEALKAEKNFNQAFVERGTPEDVREVVSKEGDLLVDIFIQEKIVSSKSEFSRLILGNAIEIVDGPKIIDGKAPALSGKTYRVGKHRFLKIK